MTNASNNMTPADFERLLEVYGSDRTRWPVEARASAGQLVSRDRAAARLLVEAEALDRVLERAPLPSLASEAALADRIAAAAMRSPRMVHLGQDKSRGAPATGMGPARNGGTVLQLPVLRVPTRWSAATGLGGVVGVLAASLALGVFIGLWSLPQRLAPAFQEFTGLVVDDRGSYALAQIDPLDEDLL